MSIPPPAPVHNSIDDDNNDDDDNDNDEDNDDDDDHEVTVQTSWVWIEMTKQKYKFPLLLAVLCVIHIIASVIITSKKNALTKGSKSFQILPLFCICWIGVTIYKFIAPQSSQNLKSIWIGFKCESTELPRFFDDPLPC